jgi:hypothetical protein
MIRQLLRLGISAGGLELALVGGAAYFTWEHDQGKHEQPSVACPICWMDRLVPVTGPSSEVQPVTSES